MFYNAYRSCITIAKKFSFNAFGHSIQCKLVNSKFIFSTRTHAVRCLLITRYCSTQYLNRSQERQIQYMKECDDKLNEMLEDQETKKKFALLELEIEYLKHMGAKVPANLRSCDWLILLETKSLSTRRKYLEFRWKVFIKEQNELKRRELNLKQKEEYLLSQQFVKNNDECIRYGLHANTMFLRIYNTKMNQYYNRQLINAMLFEPKIVFDFQFIHLMSNPEMQSCAKQLILAFALNRMHEKPVDLYFCNIDKSSELLKKIHCSIPTMYDLDFPLNVTTKSYLKVFDKDKLIYLTPNSSHVLKNYNHDDVYIIGALVDKYKPQPLTHAKAKEQGIRTARFPLSEHINWGCGAGKNLPINQVLKILLDLRLYNDWSKTLNLNIPRRKIKEVREVLLESKMKRRNKIIEMLLDNK